MQQLLQGFGLGRGLSQFPQFLDERCAHIQKIGRQLHNLLQSFDGFGDETALRKDLVFGKKPTDIRPGRLVDDLRDRRSGMRRRRHPPQPKPTFRVGITGTLDEILFGPSRLDDGSQNLVGALRTCMGAVGATNIREMQLTEIIIAPSIRTEGKIFQKAQQIGMGKT